MVSNDNDIFERIRHDDKQAFDLIFRKYYTILCRFALKLNGSEIVAEEVVQEVFIYLWEHRKNLTVSKSIVNYLFQSIKNKVYEHYRQVQIRAKYEEDYGAIDPDLGEINNDKPDDYELSCLIWNAVAQLPEKCRQIFRLSRDEGLTYQEIADHLQVSPKTVENQMGIAFKKLREILLPLLKAESRKSIVLEMMLLCILLSVYFTDNQCMHLKRDISFQIIVNSF